MFERITGIFRSKGDDEEDELNEHRYSTTCTTPPTADAAKVDRKKAKSMAAQHKERDDMLTIPSTGYRDSEGAVSASTALTEDELDHEPVPEEDLKFYQGGIRKKHIIFVKWIGRIGFVAKGVVYGCIGVLTLTNLTGAWTPNGSEANESPQGAFLLLGGIPSIGRSILIVMAVGLFLYIIWRMWEAVTGQGSDAAYGRKKNFFRYRLSPFVSGLVYTAYCYYVVQMIFQTNEEQQHSASSNTFPASWTASTIGKAGIGILAIAFLIAFTTQIINCISGNFIKDLKTSEPGRNKWEALFVHTLGRIGFGGRAALFATMSGFFWDSLANRNESGDKNMIAAAIGKLANSAGGRFFMGLLGVTLVIYALFAVLNAYYKYFPTPPPTRQEYYTADVIHPEVEHLTTTDCEGSVVMGRDSEEVSPATNVKKQVDNHEKVPLDGPQKKSFLARHFGLLHSSEATSPPPPPPPQKSFFAKHFGLLQRSKNVAPPPQPPPLKQSLFAKHFGFLQNNQEQQQDLEKGRV